MINIRALLISGIVAMSALPAAAATVQTNTVVPAYTGKLAAPTSSSANFRLNFQGSDFVAPNPNARTPWEGLGVENTAYYNSVESGGFAEYVFSKAQTAFSLMWGSPDSYNTLRFFNNLNQEVFDISGNDSAIINTPGYMKGRFFVNVLLTDLNPFTKVRFESGSDAFEYSNVAPVPLPAALPLMIAGLGAVGGLRMRRKRTS